MNNKKYLKLFGTKLPLMLFMFLFATSVFSQGITVKGKVTDNFKEPVIGANVSVAGTSIGTVTDIEGNYTLSNVGAGASISFSYIGYTTQTVPLNGRTVVNVELTEDAQQISEVVVTALGIKKDKRVLGYATSTISANELLVGGTVANPLTALYGKAAGVGIQATSSGPTGAVNIKIRGSAGLNTDSKTRPLFVVDGMPIYDKDSNMSSRDYDPLNSFDYGAGINDINPDDIESMEILKGAKASVLYGSDGANGVVLITTKKGQLTRGYGVTLSYQHTWEKPHSYIDWQNDFGSGESVNTINTNTTDGQREIVSSRYSFGPRFDGTPIRFFDGSVKPYQAYQDNFNDLFKTGGSDNLTVAVSGGNDKGSMRLSYTNYKYSGMLENQTQAKNSISFSGRMKVSDLVSFEIVSNLYSVKTRNRLGNIQDIVAWGIQRDYDYNILKGMYRTNEGYFNQDLYADGGLPNSSKSMMNWWWSQNQNRNVDRKTHNITAITANIKFTDYLNAIVRAGIDYTDIDYETKNPIMYYDSGSPSGGKYAYKRENYFIQNYEAYLTFDKMFADNRLYLSILGGTSYREDKDNSIGVSTYRGLIYEDWYSIDNSSVWPGKSEAGNARTFSRGSDMMYSVSGSATLSWEQKYILEFQARNDWSSTLPKKNNSYFYPGVSFTWNFTDDFKIPYINYGKFYTSWADVGRAAPRYYALKSYTIENLPKDASIVSIGGPDDLFSGDIKPERKREIEAGINLRMLDKNRMEVDFSFYNNNVYDQIMGVPLSSTVGANNIRINAGKVKNWGWELFVKYAPIIGKDYRWDVSFTSANQYSKVMDLYQGISRVVIGEGGYAVVADEKKRYGEILMYDYQRDDKGNRIVGSSGLYSLDRSEMKSTGKNISPDFIGGLMNSFYWKNLGLHIGLDYKYGGSIFSYSNYYLTGLGSTKNTLAYRDEKTGGIAYYVNQNNERIKCEHSQSAPSDSRDGIVYHNGMVLPGVMLNAAGEYAKNDIIASSTSYYQSYMSDMSDAFQPDALYKNNYIKVRELSLDYTVPKSVSEKLSMQKVTLSFIARNLFYLYKSLPNVDAESVLGTGNNSFAEKSFYPSMKTIGFGVNISF